MARGLPAAPAQPIGKKVVIIMLKDNLLQDIKYLLYCSIVEHNNEKY